MGLYGDADLVITKDVPFQRTLQYAINAVNVNWSLYTLKSNVKDRTGSLLFDLTPFLVVNSGDNTKLDIIIGAAFTYAVPQEGKWDLLAVLKTDVSQTFRTPAPAGRVLRFAGVTSLV